MNSISNSKCDLRLSNEKSRFLTRESIRWALIYILKEKKIDDIKIVDLVRKAGVSRSSFYKNYSSVKDVLYDIFDLAIDEVLSVIKSDMASKWITVISIFRKNQFYLTP